MLDSSTPYPYNLVITSILIKGTKYEKGIHFN